MARKDRAPNPPKRPQAPQRRSTPADPAAAARTRRLLYVIAGSGVAALAVVLLIVFLAGGGGGGERAALEDAGCTLRSFPAVPNKADHSDVATLTAKPNWNSSPPTSGPHYGQSAVWGSYDEPVPLVQTVHNLEHGGIIVHYGPDVPKPEVDKLRTWYSDTGDPNGIVIAPLPTNGDKITLSAWTAPDAATGGSRDRGRGWLASCTAFDEGAFAAFIDEHRYMGPERVPPEQLAPGT
ncbi:MAG TPA: DUF3105 domain-containing protein [Gaiellaceae bacterium]|nr:DUF3105 domain-containing protein [Gaiellaceae bacterium]